MADETPRYRFRGSIKPTAEVKRPVRAYRNAASDDEKSAGAKSSVATIDIFDVIDSWGGYWGISAGEVDQALAGLGDGVTTLYVRVNSPGGEATEGIAIANLLRAHAATVHVTNYGLAASAASVIAIAGDTLAMAPGSMLMIHKAWNYARGNADDFRDEAAILDKFDQSLAGMYALKAGGGTDWLALMGAETWFTPEDAVAAKLADTVGIETGPPPANPDDQAEPMPDVDGDSPFDRAARVFDLSVFAHPPAASAALKPPAEPPEHHQPKGADLMPDTTKALRERLGLGDDADDTAVVAKVDELLEQVTKLDEPAEVTEEQALAALAKTTGVEPDQVKAALDGAKAGKVTVSKAYLDTIEGDAKAGREARQKQLDDERDTAIKTAQNDGKLARDEDTFKRWQTAWNADPAGTKADLDKLGVRFPVNDTSGYAGHDGTPGDGAAFSDDEAAEMAALTGTPKEAWV